MTTYSNTDNTLDGTKVRLGEESADYRDEFDQQSKHPNQNNKAGRLVFLLHEDRMTLTTGLNDWKLSSNNQEDDTFQKGIYVTGGFVKVFKAFDGGNADIRILGADDVVAAGTDLQSTGVKAIVPVPQTIGTHIHVLNETTKLRSNFAGTPTAGIAQVILDVTLIPV